MSVLPRVIKRLALPADTWERHRIAAELAGAPRTVLDVGGVGGQLALFMPGAEVVSVNVEGVADATFDGIVLPYEDDSFDAALSLDVLEHIEPGGRQRHLAELARVARETVVLSCPLGSEEHVEAERELADWYRSTAGEPHRFLEDHLENGLPTEPELRTLADRAGLDFELRFHGDFRQVNRLFRLSTLARRRPAALASYAFARLDPRRRYSLDRSPRSTTNRAFLVGSPSHQPGVPARPGR